MKKEMADFLSELLDGESHLFKGDDSANEYYVISGFPTNTASLAIDLEVAFDGGQLDVEECLNSGIIVESYDEDSCDLLFNDRCYDLNLSFTHQEKNTTIIK